MSLNNCTPHALVLHVLITRREASFPGLGTPRGLASTPLQRRSGSTSKTSQQSSTLRSISSSNIKSNQPDGMKTVASGFYLFERQTTRYFQMNVRY